jgi:CRISPR-associated protein Cas1
MDEQMVGMAKPQIQELPQIQARMTFLYLEKCQLSREDNAITFLDANGVVHIPAASISVLMLGPGTSVTHRAMELIGDAGVTVIWVGESGVRYYASGKPMTHRAGLILRQAAMVSNMRVHLRVARRMYQMRFPDEDVSELTMQQLRGREGSRVRQLYRAQSRQWGVPWSGREYDPNDFSSGSPVNQSLSAGNACLYGLAHAVIAALGCSPALGFVHVGHENSFVYDIADLYKAEITIPLAFQLASEGVPNIGAETRRRVRDRMRKGKLLERMVADVQSLLQDGETEAELSANEVFLWDGSGDPAASGKNYADQEENDP